MLVSYYDITIALFTTITLSILLDTLGWSPLNLLFSIFNLWFYAPVCIFILFGFITFSVSLCLLYSLGFFLCLYHYLSALFSILYTLWFFGCHYFFSVFSILFDSLVVTISLVSSLYAILFGLPLVVSGYLCPVSLQMLFLTIQWSSMYLSAFLVHYFLRPSMILFAPSNPCWESSFPSSSNAAHECIGISLLDWKQLMHSPQRVNVTEIVSWS